MKRAITYLLLTALLITTPIFNAIAKEEAKEEKAVKESVNKKDFSVFTELKYEDFTFMKYDKSNSEKLNAYIKVLEKEYLAHPTVYATIFDYTFALLDTGQIEKADAVLTAATKEFKINPGPRIFKAWVDASKGKYIEATDIWFEHIKPKYKLYKEGHGKSLIWLTNDYTSTLGLCLAYDHLPSDKQEEVKEVVETMQRAVGHPYLGACLAMKEIKAEKLGTATSILSSYLSKFPNSTPLITLLGETQLIIGENEEALKHFNRSEEINPFSPTNKSLKEKALLKIAEKKS